MWGAMASGMNTQQVIRGLKNFSSSLNTAKSKGSLSPTRLLNNATREFEQKYNQNIDPLLDADRQTKIDLGSELVKVINLIISLAIEVKDRDTAEKYIEKAERTFTKIYETSNPRKAYIIPTDSSSPVGNQRQQLNALKNQVDQLSRTLATSPMQSQQTTSPIIQQIRDFIRSTASSQLNLTQLLNNATQEFEQRYNQYIDQLVGAELQTRIDLGSELLKAINLIIRLAIEVKDRAVAERYIAKGKLTKNNLTASTIPGRINLISSNLSAPIDSELNQLQLLKTQVARIPQIPAIPPARPQPPITSQPTIAAQLNNFINSQRNAMKNWSVNLNQILDNTTGEFITKYQYYIPTLLNTDQQTKIELGSALLGMVNLIMEISLKTNSPATAQHYIPAGDAIKYNILNTGYPPIPSNISVDPSTPVGYQIDQFNKFKDQLSRFMQGMAPIGTGPEGLRK
jgi:hypothetical protein